MSQRANFIEPLEGRQLLSLPPGLSPHEIRHAYGLDQVVFCQGKHQIHANGAGQTIAIVDAYDAPNIDHDLRVFSQKFHLPTTDANGKFVLTKATTTPPPRFTTALWWQTSSTTLTA